jgi:hypothetical protein
MGKTDVMTGGYGEVNGSPSIAKTPYRSSTAREQGATHSPRNNDE